jgi:DNA modification methylase
MNWQHCSNVGFLGIGDSYEQYYQSVRRCWRFGQTKPVHVVIVSSDAEQAVLANLKRKEEEATEMASRIVESAKDTMREELGVVASIKMDSDPTTEKAGRGWKMLLGDCVERIKEVASASVGFSVFSPPFASLYTYSASPKDMGNSKNYDQFFTHFGFLLPELLRVTMPGRRCGVHVQQVSTTKAVHGVIGWRDFRADAVKAMTSAGWVYDGEVVIDKDPQAQAIRTKAKALMFVQKNKDSSWLRPAMADYILLFRHPGENPEPIKCDVTNDEWISWARPIWYGIRESATLNAAEPRTDRDERHICPLQLETIERCVRLWSNRGDLILSPFAGIGSEGYVSITHDRQFVGIELKREYFDAACRNIASARRKGDLFDAILKPEAVAAK